MVRTFLSVLVIILFGTFLLGCGSTEERISFEDGTYRGTYSDRNEMNVSIQITLEDNIVTAVRHRHMMYKGVDYLCDDATEIEKGIAEQHKRAVEYLIGKDIRDALADLYEPGLHVDFGDYEVVGADEEFDGFAGATIRSNKDISAIVDALNRGVYRFREVGGEVPEDYSPLD